VEYYGYNQKGELIHRKAADFHARVVQHEYDHIEGILFPQKVQDNTSFTFESELKLT
jgi:peptide deformylase